MVWFGDVDIPIISDKGTAVTLETINTNFADNPPQAYKLYSELEQGSYTVFLNQELHCRSETLTEQRDSLLGMVERHGTEFPVNDSSSEGFVLVDFADVFNTPSHMFDEAEIELRYMPYDEYKSAVVCNAENATQEFSVNKNSLYATPASVNVQKNGQNITPQHSIDYSGTTVDYYGYSNLDTISWTQNTLDSTVEREIPVRLYSPNRIYSTEKNIDDAEIDNEIYSLNIDASKNVTKLSVDGSVFAEIDYTHSVGYIEKNENDVVSVTSIDGETISSYRGYPVAEYEVTRNNFVVGIDSPSVVTQEDYYVVVENADGVEVIVIRSIDGGAISVDANGVTMPSNGNKNSFFVGYVPDNLPAQEIAQSAYSRGSWRRTFVTNA